MRGQGRRSTVAVMASTVLTARMTQGHSKTRIPSRTPTERTSEMRVKYCQTLPERPRTFTQRGS